jgi:sporulation protein YlmC with PRC-barrel domain
MYLVRDVLDKQVVDRRQVRIGKVDGIVLTAENGGPLKVAFIEMGSLTLIRRLSRRLHGWMLCLFQEARPGGSEPSYRIPWSKITDVGVDIEADIDNSETPLEQAQEWLRQHVLRHVPGGLS